MATELLDQIKEGKGSITELMMAQDELLIKLYEEIESMTATIEELRTENEDLKQKLSEAEEKVANVEVNEDEAKEEEPEETAPETPEEEPEEDLSDFRVVGLKLHNEYRAKHGSPPLELDDKLNNIAQAYAERLAQINTLIHSQNGYGENLYGGQGGGSDEVDAVQKAVQTWYNEIAYYNWSYPGFTMQTGHFSQVVWANTTSIGVGVASNSLGGIFVCVNYSPPGNYQGQFHTNVSYPN